MKKYNVKKIEAARRQIDAAIRMLFAKEDPVAILTIASAGERILRDIAETRGDVPIHLSQKDIIQDGMEKEYWKYMNAPFNFLKHAKNDPNGIYIGFKDEFVDVTLSMACLYYKGLGHKLTPEMNAFSIWFMTQNPSIIKQDALIRKQIENNLIFIAKMSREAKLEVGRRVLEKIKSGL